MVHLYTNSVVVRVVSDEAGVKRTCHAPLLWITGEQLPMHWKNKHNHNKYYYVKLLRVFEHTVSNKITRTDTKPKI